MKLFTFDPQKNKKVLAGDYLECSHTFYKKVTPKHYMIKEHGYGISEDVMEQLTHLGCHYIKIITKSKTYNITFLLYQMAAIKNYGHGNQRFLRIK